MPYQGTGPAMTDLVGGQVDFMCDQTTNTTGQIQGGEVKAYAVTTPERLAALPDLPTTAEAGLPDFQVGVWHGLYAPAGTPEEVVAKLTAALQAALQDPNVVARFAELGTTPVAAEQATPEAHASYLPRRSTLWKPIIEAAGVMRRSDPAPAAPAPAPHATAQRIAQGHPVAGLIFIGFGLAFGIAALGYRARHRAPHGAGLFPAGARRRARAARASRSSSRASPRPRRTATHRAACPGGRWC